ncbi:PAS domain-containing protein, partial [Selenomonas sp.]
KTFENGKIQLPTGELAVRELRAMMKLLGVDITFIDAADHLRYFENEGKVFARPKLALGRPVYDCHPTQIVPVVKNLLADFKAKRRDHMTIFRRIAGKPIGVRYHAVYDDDGTYLGAVEFVQDFTEALEHFQK